MCKYVIPLQTMISHYQRMLTHLKTALQAASENEELLYRVSLSNPWFTTQHCHLSLSSHIQSLEEKNTHQWLEQESNYLNSPNKSKKVGLILAGNLPLVGLHDVMCTLLSGHHALIKLSSSDSILSKWVIEKWAELCPELLSHVSFVDGFMKEADIFIGTGSNNSARYFEYYFQNKPHLIRKNRNSVAILKSDTSKTERLALAEDVFSYFGMGCRNVTHLYLPENYDFAPLFESFERYKDCIHHHKYANNYTYHKAILLMNLDKHLDTGFLICKESEKIAAPVSMLYYSYYRDITSVLSEIQTHAEHIQCVVSPADTPLPGVQTLRFGETQKPQLWDYADGINTMAFLHKAAQSLA